MKPVESSIIMHMYSIKVVHVSNAMGTTLPIASTRAYARTNNQHALNQSACFKSEHDSNRLTALILSYSVA